MDSLICKLEWVVLFLLLECVCLNLKIKMDSLRRVSLFFFMTKVARRNNVRGTRRRRGKEGVKGGIKKVIAIIEQETSEKNNFKPNLQTKQKFHLAVS